MRLQVRGAGSLDLPLRVFALLAQQGTVVNRAVIDLADKDYRLTIDLITEHGARIVEKIRAMVLVDSVELSEPLDGSVRPDRTAAFIVL